MNTDNQYIVPTSGNPLRCAAPLNPNHHQCLHYHLQCYLKYLSRLLLYLHMMVALLYLYFSNSLALAPSPIDDIKSLQFRQYSFLLLLIVSTHYHTYSHRTESPHHISLSLPPSISTSLLAIQTPPLPP